MPVMEHDEKVRTTVRVPKPLYEEAQEFVHKNVTPAVTINEFIINAICAYVRLMKRKQIDAAFAGMAEDTDYQKEARLISEDFSQSDWEAFEAAEREVEAVVG
jgi:hypothetical protein